MIFRSTIFVITILVFSSLTMNAQLRDSSDVILQQRFSKAIEDNSFLIEEAYNQEERIVQHISNAVYFSRPQRDVVYTFTQEWPIGGLRHQVSFTIPYAFLNSNTINGMSDLMLNYRYQLFTSDDWAAAAPRVTIILPTGNVDKNLGFGTAGLQLSLPISKRISEFFVVHFNIGYTLLPAAQSPRTINNIRVDKHRLTWYNLGGSIIWLAEKKFNIMLEYLLNITDDFDDAGNVNRIMENFINPGIRYAIDIGELQIVPGVGFPYSFTQEGSRFGMVFYLSFEHPF